MARLNYADEVYPVAMRPGSRAVKVLKEQPALRGAHLRSIQNP